MPIPDVPPSTSCSSKTTSVPSLSHHRTCTLDHHHSSRPYTKPGSLVIFLFFSLYHLLPKLGSLAVYILYCCALLRPVLAKTGSSLLSPPVGPYRLPLYLI
ncbi:hypothetical protein PCASD_03650, partial [Puccinia coronata f. sp. avenae]